MILLSSILVCVIVCCKIISHWILCPKWESFVYSCLTWNATSISYQSKLCFSFFFSWFIDSLMLVPSYICCPIWLVHIQMPATTKLAMGSAMAPFYKLTSLMWFGLLIYHFNMMIHAGPLLGYNFHNKFVHKYH